MFFELEGQSIDVKTRGKPLNICDKMNSDDKQRNRPILTKLRFRDTFSTCFEKKNDHQHHHDFRTNKNIPL